jgi:hypothetical protein
MFGLAHAPGRNSRVYFDAGVTCPPIISRKGERLVSQRVKNKLDDVRPPLAFVRIPWTPAFSIILANCPLRPCFPPVPRLGRDETIGALPIPAFFKISRSSCGCRGRVSGFLVLLAVNRMVCSFQSIALHCMSAASPSCLDFAMGILGQGEARLMPPARSSVEPQFRLSDRMNAEKLFHLDFLATPSLGNAKKMFLL